MDMIMRAAKEKRARGSSLSYLEIMRHQVVLLFYNSSSTRKQLEANGC